MDRRLSRATGAVRAIRVALPGQRERQADRFPLPRRFDPVELFLFPSRRGTSSPPARRVSTPKPQPLTRCFQTPTGARASVHRSWIRARLFLFLSKGPPRPCAKVVTRPRVATLRRFAKARTARNRRVLEETRGEVRGVSFSCSSARRELFYCVLYQRDLSYRVLPTTDCSYRPRGTAHGTTSMKTALAEQRRGCPTHLTSTRPATAPGEREPRRWPSPFASDATRARPRAAL
mmetsp:Transcript_4180/g.13952  ORF Transcript_4180/g.13952 Transcript_4180/m.13952 type:complete len:233 (+) Transcript_4180:1168-1866(+)